MKEQEAIALEKKVMVVAGVSLIFQALPPIFSGALRGAGDTFYVATYSLFTITFVRPILTYLFIYKFGFGLFGAWFALSADQFLRTFFSYLRIKSGKWLEKEV